MARNFEILINPGANVQGELSVGIDANRIRREGETEADTPDEPIISPSVEIDTTTPITATWDVPDTAVIAGETVNVGVEFSEEVVQMDGSSLEEKVSNWLSFHGLEVSNIRVEAIDGEEFALRVSQYPRSIGHDAEFNVGVRTTFGTQLSAAPTASALSLSAGTVDSVCQIIENESYLFNCTSPASGTDDITITAVAAGWSNITSNALFDERIELTS